MESGPCGRPEAKRAGGRCLLHAPKEDNRWSEEEFNPALDKVLAEAAAKSQPPDLTGVEFPRHLFNDRVEQCLSAGAQLSGAVFQGFFSVGDLMKRRTVTVAPAVRMASCRFPGGASFHNVVFKEPVDLWVARSAGDVGFFGCVFEQGLSAVNLQVDGELRFHGCEFHGSCNLHSIEVKGRTLLLEVSFDSSLVMRSGNLAGGLVYAGCRAQSLDISDAFLGDDAFFEQSRGNAKNLSTVGELAFTNVALRKSATVRFRRVNLSDATFSKTNVEGFTFSDVSWPVVRPRLRPKRSVLAAELKLGRDATAPDLELVAENYRQLVLNYEAKRDHEMAEEFHIGEMEMRRRKGGAGTFGWRRWRAEWLSGFGVYSLLSRYGTSYRRAFGWLVGAVAVAAVAVLFAGFQPLHSLDGGPGPVVEYNLRPSDEYQPVSFSEMAFDLLDALGLAGSMLVLQHSRYYAPIDATSRVVQNVAVLPLAGQSALLLLAIRRRFKR